MPQQDFAPPIRENVVDANRRITAVWSQHFSREPTVQIEAGTTPQGTPRDGVIRVAADGSALFVRVGGAWFTCALTPV
jgi:hypothetical protein